MNWMQEQVLRKHGWKQSQENGSWYRKHDELGKERRTEFLGGPYLPKYEREVKKLERSMR